MSIQSLQGTNSSYQGSAQGTVSTQQDVRTSSAADNANQQAQDAVQITSQLQTANGQNNTAGETEENSKRQNSQIKRAVDDINRNAKNTEAVFGIHDDTNRVTIKIIDKESKKVIKEFPPEKTLDMIAKVWEMAGLMVDEKR